MPFAPLRAVAAVVITGAVLLPRAAAAQAPPTSDAPVSTSALINEQLDHRITLSLDGPFTDALKKIQTESGGVAVTADPLVYDALPWGGDTTIRATFKNVLLRHALDGLAHKLGLTWRLGDQSVELEPMPALKRLGRRATVEELSALNLLSTTPLKIATTEPTIQQLLSTVDSALEAAKSDFAVENRAFAPSAQATKINVARNATLADGLEALARQTEATWYVWGRSIEVLRKDEAIRLQLAKKVSLHVNDADVAQVLGELSTKSGVPFEIERGAQQRVPVEFRKVRLTLDGASVQQALEAIQGSTGLGYVITDRGVYIWNQNPNPPAPATAPAR
jgi:hypothetical protein